MFCSTVHVAQEFVSEPNVVESSIIMLVPKPSAAMFLHAR